MFEKIYRCKNYIFLHFFLLIHFNLIFIKQRDFTFSIIDTNKILFIWQLYQWFNYLIICCIRYTCVVEALIFIYTL